MSLLRTLIGLVKSQEETNERPKNPSLKTRYYKESSDKLLQTILDLLDKELPKWNVVHVDKERGEIMVEKKEWLGKNDIVISIYRISPSSSAIDLVSAKRGFLGDFGSSYRNILQFFHQLDKVIKPVSS